MMKRDDLNHPVIQGNKWRKLKHNLTHAQARGVDGLVTFGGAHSNHIAATAHAARACGLLSIGFIRGDELQAQPERWSETLHGARAEGMQLVFLSRSEYRLKHRAQAVQETLQASSRRWMLLPEGGSNARAVSGVAEIVDELQAQLDEPPSDLITACGSGGTLAGLMAGVARAGWPTRVWGVPALRGADAALRQAVRRLCPMHARVQWDLLPCPQAGRFAHTSPALAAFADRFDRQYGVPLDRVYTVRTCMATFAGIERGAFIDGARLVIVHTGGLQGGTAGFHAGADSPSMSRISPG